MRIARLLILSMIASSAAAATVVPVREFRSVELSNGGHVVVRHGAVQRVSVVSGDPRCTEIRVSGDRRLTINHHGDCPRRDRHDLEIEVVTPRLTGVFVSNGGSMEVVGDFPAQASIEAGVEQGGTVDVRSIAADDADASVFSGGRIFLTARKSLSASVRSGGIIHYWGDPHDVSRSIRDGGAVTRGD